MASKFIFEVDDMAEGVYMASGAAGDGCFTVTARIHQTPEIGREDYRIQIDAQHNADHNSNAQQLEITFNQPVNYKECYGAGAACAGGDGTTTLFVNYTYHCNHTESIGMGDLVVTSGAGLAVTSVTLHDTGKY